MSNPMDDVEAALKVPEVFLQLLKNYGDDYRSLRIRIVAMALGDDLVLLGGRALFEDKEAARLKRFQDCFADNNLVLLEEILPVESAEEFFRNACRGEVTISGRKVRFLTKIDSQSSTSVIHSLQHRRVQAAYRDGEVAWEEETIFWTGCNPEKLVGWEWLNKTEQSLASMGRGYSSFADLSRSFLPGMEIRQGNSIQFEMDFPIRIRIRASLTADQHIVEVKVGQLVKRDQLRLTVVGYADGNAQKEMIRKPWVGSQLKWNTKQGELVARVAIDAANLLRVDTIVSYKGTRLRAEQQSRSPFAHTPSLQQWVRDVKKAAGQAIDSDWRIVLPDAQYMFALLHIDVMGHSALLRNLGSRARTALERFEEVFEASVAGLDGKSDFSGDGGLALFVGKKKYDRVATLAFQLVHFVELMHVSDPDQTCRLDLKIAVHCGECEWKRRISSMHDDAINVTAHVQKASKGPAILATKDILEHLPPSLRPGFRRLPCRVDGHQVYGVAYARYAELPLR